MYTCVCEPTFYIIFHNLYGARQVFGVVAGEKFYVDIDNSAIRYYSGNIYIYIYIYIYIGDTSAYNLVYVLACVIAEKVNVCVCEDGVKLNYSRLILS